MPIADICILKIKDQLLICAQKYDLCTLIETEIPLMETVFGS